jgi:uncharacterized membrane protein HdeD (DUF308 family)
MMMTDTGTEVLPMKDAGQAFDELGAAIARNWGWIMLRGVLGIVIGIIALANPMTTVKALLLLFAVFSIIDGITALYSALRAFRQDQSWFWLLLQGVISLAAAAVALAMPVLAVKVFIFIMAFWAVLGGIVLVVAAFKLPSDHGRWWLAIGGGLSILWGVLLFTQPIVGAMVLAIWFGIYALVAGILFAVIAWTLRGRHKARLARA